MMSKIEFTNPDNLPLEHLTICVNNSGVVQQIKALDPYWVEKRDLILYEKPPCGSNIVMGAVETWKTRMEAYLEEVKWLLGLEHYRFWSMVLYHPNCMDTLVSFLQEANPPYMPPYECKNVQKLYEDIRRVVLTVFSRLITNRESKMHWISKETMSELIYDKFIFTIPIVWDICLVYGVDNAQHVARLAAGVFALQPRYERDALAALAFVTEAFKYIILQVNKDYDSIEPPNLPETFKGFGEIRRPTNNKQERMTFSMLKDLVVHLLDTALTLRIFLEAYPRSITAFRKTNFIISIAQLYEYGIPHLYEKLQEVGDETSVSYPEVEGFIDSARAELIDIFREILAVYKNAIFNGQDNISMHVEDFLAVMMEGLSERLFIQDYHSCYPVHEDLEMLKQAYPDIDSVKTDFILQAVYSNLEETVPEPKVTNGHVETTDNVEPGPSKDSDIPNDIRQESLISEVKDILPHLGDGFILKCLEYYGFNSARVINSVLEDNLASELRGLDHSLPIIPEDALDTNFLETGIERLNVFDGDQFDIMTRDDVDVSKIHVGKKKGKYKDLRDMLNDKSDMKKVADIYSKYNLVCDESALYSDEYDDTYDSDGAGPSYKDVEEVVPRVLRNARRERQEESEEESEEEKNVERSKQDFCVNPEEARARREARRGGAGRAAWRVGGGAATHKSADVVGKAKGQGQEKDVLKNRDRKEKHKSARGNHNRRHGAQWKRSQGMVPS